MPKSLETAAACGAASLACESCNPGQACNGGVCSDCPAACPDGCCSGKTCLPRGLASCGNRGAACAACDPIAADNCNARGQCACGAGPACGPGQHCVGGTCACDAVSCPSGCCRNNLCETPSPDAGVAASLRLCGKNARACNSCDPVRSDTCTSTGQCACGANPPCEPGNQCVNGTCVCNAATCSGCCSPDGLSCRVPGTVNDECGKNGFTCQRCDGQAQCADGRCSSCTSVTCGRCCSGSACLAAMPGPCPLDGGLCPCGQGGAICQSCATLATDTCNADGSCSCGPSPACRPGQHCVRGQCLCDAASCPTGCCSGTSCAQPSVQQCGSNGSSCFACSPTLANNCSSTGDCRCGSGPACRSGERCSTNGCVCDCPNGCCTSTNACIAPSFPSNCGLNGSSCVPCDVNRSDSCANGNCSCGGGPSCPVGYQCDNSVCRRV